MHMLNIEYNHVSPLLHLGLTTERVNIASQANINKTWEIKKLPPYADSSW